MLSQPPRIAPAFGIIHKQNKLLQIFSFSLRLIYLWEKNFHVFCGCGKFQVFFSTSSFIYYTWLNWIGSLWFPCYIISKHSKHLEYFFFVVVEHSRALFTFGHQHSPQLNKTKLFLIFFYYFFFTSFLDTKLSQPLFLILLIRNFRK